MCGIAGYNLTLDDLVNVNTTNLAIDLLHQIESRGTDATGAAWWEDGTLMVQKDGMRARWFTEFMEMPNGVRNAILHTRFGTKGHESNNDNNHPIVTGKIVGVHNGCIYNDDELFKEMGLDEYRIAQVDTEAIFASIAYGSLTSPGGTPRLANDLKGVLEKIEGSAAIAWFEIEGDDSIMHAARLSSSPFYYGHTASGSFIFASERDHLKKACDNNGIELVEIAFLNEGDYITVKDGKVIDGFKFDPADRWSAYTGTSYSYRGSSGRTYSSKNTNTYPSNTSTATTQKQLTAGEKRVFGHEGDDTVLTPPKGIVLTKQFETAVSNLAPTKLPDGYQTVLSPKMVQEHLVYWFDIASDVAINEESFRAKYGPRVASINEWNNRLKAQNFSKINEWLSEMGAHIRPGMSILTDIPGNERLFGHVVLLPTTFPHGSYILRVMVPNSRYPGGYETLLVERKLDEFVVVTAYDNESDPFDKF